MSKANILPAALHLRAKETMIAAPCSQYVQVWPTYQKHPAIMKPTLPASLLHNLSQWITSTSVTVLQCLESNLIPWLSKLESSCTSFCPRNGSNDWLEELDQRPHD